MSYDNGFARAQQMYDNMLPPEYDGPGDNKAKFTVSGSVLDTPENREILDSLNAEGVEVVGDDGPEIVCLGFTIENKGDIEDIESEYHNIKSQLNDIIIGYDIDDYKTEYDEPEDPRNEYNPDNELE